MTRDMERVTIIHTDEQICTAIINLAQRRKIMTCDKCTTSACNKCMQNWYDSRNAGIQILRDVFNLAKGRDVPKPVFFLADREAKNFLDGIISEEFVNGMRSLRKLEALGKLSSMIPNDTICPMCELSVPPSRFGYVINGPEPVCWECEVKRSNAKK